MRKLLLVFIIFFCIPFTLLAQKRTITGTVVDGDGNPAQGVNVTVKGNKKEAAQTDKGGNFSITVSEAGKVPLVLSSTEFKSKNVTADGSTPVSVKMERNVSTQDEVVVIGYQSVKAKDVTGAVSTLGAKQIKDIPVNSTTEALTGRIAGVQITTDEGVPGSSFNILVRGGGSITQDNAPLYVIDGIEVPNGLSDLAPQDIESLTTLKDAAATAIYGAKGANGVIIITTKGGKNAKGKTTVAYNGFIGFRELPKELPAMGPEDFVATQYEFHNFASDSSTFRSSYDPLNLGWNKVLSYRDTLPQDWQRQVFGRKAMMQTQNVSISGGDDKTQYNLSLTANSEQGLQLTSEFDRKIVNFKFDHIANDKFKFGFNARYNEQVVNGPGTSDQGSAAANSLRQTIKYHPLLTPEQAQDPSNIDPSGNGLFLVNPLLLLANQYRNIPTTVINLNGYLNYTFNDYLSFKTTVGYNVNTNTANTYNDSLTYTSQLNGSRYAIAEIDRTQLTTFNNSNVFTYSNAKGHGKFKDHNDISAILGEETLQTAQTELDITEKYFPHGTSATKALNNLSLASPSLISATQTEPTPVTNGSLFDNPVNQLSFFTRINYARDKKYLLSLTFRADGSSIFQQASSPWGYFPAASAAWKISEERFMKKINFISEAKLRLSYGTAGNNRIPPFLGATNFGTQAPGPNTSSSGLTSVVYGFNNQPVSGFAPQNLGNSNLKWETTVSKNIGLDLGFFKNRVQLTVDAYQNDTRDLLIPLPVPAYLGYTTQYQNIGSTRNTGLEIQLTTSVIQRKDFNWTATFNISFNNNKVLALGGGLDSILAISGWETTTPDFLIQPGKPLGQIFGLVNDGYYTTNDFNVTPAPVGSPLPYLYTLKAGVPTNTISGAVPMPGSPKYKDIAGTGNVGPVQQEETVIGNTRPKFFGGLNQQFSYKGFDMSIFVNFQYGNQVLNANKIEYTNQYTSDGNMLAIMNNRWKTIDGNGNQVEISTLNSANNTANPSLASGAVYGVSPDALNALNKNAKYWIPSTSYSYYTPQSFAVEDGSFIRLNNITVGYTLPKKFLRKAKISSLRIYGTLNNLAVGTSYSGYDPEVNTRHATPLTPGVDYSAYPRSKSFICGINLTL